LRIKEQETRLTLREHDDDDDDGFPQFQELESFTFCSIGRFRSKRLHRHTQFDDYFIRAHW
jgi:hypothetical protein